MSLKNYEMFDKVSKRVWNLLGLSKEQTDSFDYEEILSEGKVHPSQIHVSHFILGTYQIVYNKKYILSKEEVIYLLNDLGGNYERK